MVSCMNDVSTNLKTRVKEIHLDITVHLIIIARNRFYLAYTFKFVLSEIVHIQNYCHLVPDTSYVLSVLKV